MFGNNHRSRLLYDIIGPRGGVGPMGNQGKQGFQGFTGPGGSSVLLVQMEQVLLDRRVQEV
jgi:hypothetical protein